MVLACSGTLVNFMAFFIKNVFIEESNFGIQKIHRNLSSCEEFSCYQQTQFEQVLLIL